MSLLEKVIAEHRGLLRHDDMAEEIPVVLNFLVESMKLSGERNRLLNLSHKVFGDRVCFWNTAASAPDSIRLSYKIGESEYTVRFRAELRTWSEWERWRSDWEKHDDDRHYAWSYPNDALVIGLSAFGDRGTYRFECWDCKDTGRCSSCSPRLSAYIEKDISDCWLVFMVEEMISK